ncbi:hypothetical protein C1646_755307 [Rhizophagus diaphanus]|nr:hypothetical protein C1646_755307 [Rhizophagus diaphanus] [Rhizophagus sp. MUCL 43196]
MTSFIASHIYFKYDLLREHSIGDLKVYTFEDYSILEMEQVIADLENPLNRNWLRFTSNRLKDRSLPSGDFLDPASKEISLLNEFLKPYILMPIDLHQIGVQLAVRSYKPQTPNQRSCPNIVHLDFASGTDFNDEIISIVAKTYPDLRHLALPNSGITAKGLYDSSKICKKIKYLDISRCNLITEQSLIGISYNCQSLEELHLSGITRITSLSIIHILSSCPNLRILDISDIDGSGIEDNIIKLFPMLRELNMREAGFVDDTFVALICEDDDDCVYPGFKHLDLGFTNITNRAIKIIAERCINLRYLDIKYCNISDRAIRAIASSCDELRYLNLMGCNSITIKLLNRLSIYIPNTYLDYLILDEDSWSESSDEDRL